MDRFSLAAHKSWRWKISLWGKETLPCWIDAFFRLGNIFAIGDRPAKGLESSNLSCNPWENTE